MSTSCVASGTLTSCRRTNGLLVGISKFLFDVNIYQAVIIIQVPLWGQQETEVHSNSFGITVECNRCVSSCWSPAKRNPGYGIPFAGVR